MGLIDPDTGETRVGDSKLHILFSSKAFRLAEAQMGSFKEWGERLSQNPSYTDITTLLWAGLEGFRRRNGTRAEPFTVDDADDLVDEVGLEAASTDITIAVTHARSMRLSPEMRAKVDEAMAQAKGKAGTNGANGSGGDADPKAATSSSPAPEPASIPSTPPT